MSQWNNSYAYNNQFQGSNNWQGDPSNVYSNQQNYYNNGTYEPANQYVSFDEFISQMQPNGAPNNSANYNVVQYVNVPNYAYQPAAQVVPNGVQSFPSGAQDTPQPAPSSSTYTSELVSKSNLTATATEFVPKGSSTSNAPNVKPSSSSKDKSSDYSKPNNSYREKPNTNSSSSDRNWRERPSSNRQQKEPNPSESTKNNETENHNSNSSRNRNRDYANTNQENRSRNNEYNSSQENRSRNHEYNSSQENRNRNNDYNGPQENRSRNHEYSSSSQDNRTRHHDYNNSGHESRNRNNDYNTSSQDSRNRNQESSSIRSETYYQNDRNEKSNSKFNNKQKNKHVEQTFYNSKIQDSKNRGEGSGRSKVNWSGTQRLKAGERGNPDDEQVASSYMQYRDRDDKVERITREAKSSPVRNKPRQNEVSVPCKELTQRERLSDQLDKGTLECLVCCERVKQTDSVWSCGNCYHVLHLRCIRKWAMSSMVEGKWRCPACQNTSDTIPADYRCMCGAARNPEFQRGTAGAHTCGKSCQRPRACPHPCTLLCHPGPCPPCQATVNKQCGCGAETRSVMCSSKLPQVCGRTCSKPLECGAHACSQDCHDDGPCDECSEMVTQVCYCPGAKSRTIPCTSATSRALQFSCAAPCGRVLACGAHVCRAPCHPPPCRDCELRPDAVNTCPCQRTKLEEGARKKCTDPIPLCGNICAKPLPCGPDGDKHFCKLDCHHGPCPVCPDTTLVQCRCGHSSQEIPCKDLPEMADNVRCQRKCNKKLSCGRHRCRAVCCNCSSHRCEIVCGRLLSCQLHRCERNCHTARCDPCPTVSFSELRCACGAQVVYPPVRCGTRRPPCAAPCPAPRACGHPPHHTCHAGDCPPCVVLTTKTCHGGHEERKTIPCSQEEFSCGLPCGKPLSCGKHNCIKICHKGPCDTEKCTQPCREKRPCGHECAAWCHSSSGGTCPAPAPCRAAVRVTCPCRVRSATRTCADNAAQLDKMVTALAATKMQDGGTVDLSDVQKPEAMLRTLECNDECRVEARSRQLALALQIRNPDISSKLAPRYSDFLRTNASKDPAFATQVHEKLTDLVQLAKKSKQKTRSHSFPSMNWQKRQFIHELCEHFGCESVAYDAEPNRNVVATADKEKSWLPAMSVLEVVSREAGKRRVPGPVLRANAAPPATNTAPSKTTSGWATLTSTNTWAARTTRSAPAPSAGPSSTAPAPSAGPSSSAPFPAGPSSYSSEKPPADKIDYFDNPPEN